MNSRYRINGSEEPVTREMLDACSTWVECNYVPRSEAPLTYMVSFYSTDEMRRDGIPDVYADNRFESRKR